MTKRADVHLELALRALERAPRFLAGRTMAIPEAALIVAFRNMLAHGYATLDQSRVYDPATTKVAALIAAIRTPLDEFPGG